MMESTPAPLRPAALARMSVASVGHAWPPCSSTHLGYICSQRVLNVAFHSPADGSPRMSSSSLADTARSIHGGGLAAAQDRIGAWFAAERERWPLWMPVMVDLGIAVYFGLSEEPPPWLGPMLVAGVGAAGLTLFAWPIDRLSWLRPAIVAALAIAAGFAAAQIKALAVDTRMLNERFGPTLVTGLVDRVESFPDGQRVTLRRPTIAGLSDEKAPEAVRVRLRS